VNGELSMSNGQLATGNTNLELQNSELVFAKNKNPDSSPGLRIIRINNSLFVVHQLVVFMCHSVTVELEAYITHAVLSDLAPHREIIVVQW